MPLERNFIAGAGQTVGVGASAWEESFSYSQTCVDNVHTRKHICRASGESLDTAHHRTFTKIEKDQDEIEKEAAI
jgi:hypothetical protein